MLTKSRNMPQAMQDSMTEMHLMDDDPIAIAYLYTQEPFKNAHFPWAESPLHVFTSKTALVKTDPLLTDEHRSKAKIIRAYFRDKLMLAALTDSNMSQFRKDLWSFLDRDDTSYKVSELGMIQKLPLFYAEDQFLEKIREDWNNTPRNKAKDNPGGEHLTLTYIGRFEKRTQLSFSKSRNCISYWFHDEDDRLFNIILEEYNPFRDVWMEMLQQGPIDINCIAPVRENYRSVIDLHYLDSGNWILDSR